MADTELMVSTCRMANAELMDNAANVIPIQSAIEDKMLLLLKKKTHCQLKRYSLPCSFIEEGCGQWYHMQYFYVSACCQRVWPTQGDICSYHSCSFRTLLLRCPVWFMPSSIHLTKNCIHNEINEIFDLLQRAFLSSTSL